MGEVVIISALLPGGDFSVSGQYLRVNMGGNFDKEDAYHNALDLKEDVPESLIRTLKFSPPIQHPSEEKRPAFLVRNHMEFGENFTPQVLTFIKQGMAITTTLQIGVKLPGTNDDVDFSLEMGYVLKETDGGAFLLGVMRAKLDDEEREQRDYSPVAMLDLLGFSEILLTHSLDEIEKRYTRTLMSAITTSSLFSMEAMFFDNDGNLLIPDQAVSISFGVFSDTVVLYPKPKTSNPLSELCKIVANLFDISLQGDWLFRGGVDYGTFRALPEHNLYIGTGLIGAHRIEASQDWAGIVVGPRAQERYPSEIRQMRESHLLVDYPVPIKGQNGVVSTQQLVVNWCYFKSNFRVPRLRKLRSLYNKAPDVAKPKIMATIEFCRTMQRRKLASLRSIGGKAYGNPVPEDISQEADDC